MAVRNMVRCALFAALLLAEKWIPALKQLPGALRHIYVMGIVIISFVIFNADSLGQAWEDILGMFGGVDIPLVTSESVYYLRSYAMLLILGIAGATPLCRNLAARLEQSRLTVVLRPAAAVALLLVCTAYLVDGSFNPFLYFRF